MNTIDLENYLNQLLKPEDFKDYCPNGLQVEGKKTIKKIITGVTACQALIDQAIEKKADALVVHHGYFWGGENPCIIGMKKNRLAALLNNDINLFAYHLPLDAHVEFGNNVELAKKLNINVDINQERVNPLLFNGTLNTPMSGEDFSAHINNALSHEPLFIPGRKNKITKIAWCTGAAQDFIEEAHAMGVDAFLTGEVSERTVHFARENNIHFFAAGHHATEKYGIKALGNHLAEKFELACEFIDIENPV